MSAWFWSLPPTRWDYRRHTKASRRALFRYLHKSLGRADFYSVLGTSEGMGLIVPRNARKVPYA